MKITQEADYALRMMCRLVVETRKGNTPVGAAILAEGVAVPTRFGLKILHKLAGAGLVNTTRGVSGGYRLAVDPKRLTLRQVIEAIDGPITLNRCVAESHICLYNPNKDVCRLHHVFETLNAQVVERLDRLTLSQLSDDTLPLDTLLACLA